MQKPQVSRMIATHALATLALVSTAIVVTGCNANDRAEIACQGSDAVMSDDELMSDCYDGVRIAGHEFTAYAKAHRPIGVVVVPDNDEIIAARPLAYAACDESIETGVRGSQQAAGKKADLSAEEIDTQIDEALKSPRTALRKKACRQGVDYHGNQLGYYNKGVGQELDGPSARKYN